MSQVLIDQAEYDLLRDIAKLMAYSSVPYNHDDEKLYDEAVQLAKKHSIEYRNAIPTVGMPAYDTALVMVGQTIDDREILRDAAEATGTVYNALRDALVHIAMFGRFTRFDDDLVIAGRQTAKSLMNIGFNGPRHGGMSMLMGDNIMTAATIIHAQCNRIEALSTRKS